MLTASFRQRPTTLRQFSLAARFLDGFELSHWRRGCAHESSPTQGAALTPESSPKGVTATKLGPIGRVGPPESPELIKTFELLKHWGMAEGDVTKLARKVKPVHLAERNVSTKLRWMTAELRFTRPEALSVLGAFPPVLAFSVDEHLVPFVEAFQGCGCSRGDVKRIILENPVTLARRDRSVRSMDYLRETLDLERSQTVKIFVSKPELLNLNIASSLKPMLECLLNLGLAKSEIGSLICKCPFLLTRPLDDLNRHFDKFRELGFSDRKVGEILMGAPTLMWSNFNKAVTEKLRWLEVGLGFDRGTSLDCLLKHPVRFVASLDTWKDTYIWMLTKGMTTQEAMKFFKQNFNLFSFRSGGLNGRYAFAKDILKKTVTDVLNCPEYLGARFDLIITRVAFLRSIGVDVEATPLDSIVLEKSRFADMYGKDDGFLEYMKWKGLSEERKVHIATRGLWGKMRGRGVH